MGNAERVILITLKTQTQKNRLTFGKTVLIYNQMAGWTRLELAASCVTGRRSNQLNYHPSDFSIMFMTLPFYVHLSISFFTFFQKNFADICICIQIRLLRKNIFCLIF